MTLGGRLKSVAVGAADPAVIRRSATAMVDRFGLWLFSGDDRGVTLYSASDRLNYSGVSNIVIPLLISMFIVLSTMIGSVYERKREIGIYTSVGMAPSHVSILFIAEAVVLAGIGGLAGLIIGTVGAWLLGILVPALPTYTPWSYVVFAELLAATIGLAAGVLPAYRAASLDPIEALRAE